MALRTAEAQMADDGTYLFPRPLAAVEHLVLDKANMLATNEAAAREPIAVITDREAIKVKASDRRGALWKDDQGIWWLLAAGIRKNDGPGDFYRKIEKYGRDSTPIAPSPADHRYRKFEEAYLGACAAERAAQAKLLTALIESCRVLPESTAVELFGASVQVTATPDDEETVVLQLDWEFMKFDEQDRFPSDVLAMIPGLESIDDWEYLPPKSDADSPHSWYTYVDRKWIDWLATSAELDELDQLVAIDWEPPNPSSDGSERFSHLSPSRVVTVGYIEGIEIPGLCGAAVVPHRDPEQLPVCPTCGEALELLRQLRSR